MADRNSTKTETLASIAIRCLCLVFTLAILWFVWDSAELSTAMPEVATVLADSGWSENSDVHDDIRCASTIRMSSNSVFTGSPTTGQCTHNWQDRRVYQYAQFINAATSSNEVTITINRTTNSYNRLVYFLYSDYVTQAQIAGCYPVIAFGKEQNQPNSSGSLSITFTARPGASYTLLVTTEWPKLQMTEDISWTFVATSQLGYMVPFYKCIDDNPPAPPLTPIPFATDMFNVGSVKWHRSSTSTKGLGVRGYFSHPFINSGFNRTLKDAFGHDILLFTKNPGQTNQMVSAQYTVRCNYSCVRPIPSATIVSFPSEIPFETQTVAPPTITPTQSMMISTETPQAFVTPTPWTPDPSPSPSPTMPAVLEVVDKVGVVVWSGVRLGSWGQRNASTGQGFTASTAIGGMFMVGSGQRELRVLARFPESQGRNPQSPPAGPGDGHMGEDFAAPQYVSAAAVYLDPLSAPLNNLLGCFKPSSPFQHDPCFSTRVAEYSLVHDFSVTHVTKSIVELFPNARTADPYGVSFDIGTSQVQVEDLTGAVRLAGSAEAHNLEWNDTIIGIAAGEIVGGWATDVITFLFGQNHYQMNLNHVSPYIDTDQISYWKLYSDSQPNDYCAPNHERAQYRCLATVTPQPTATP